MKNKKIYLVLLIGLLFIVGCGKKEVKYESRLSSLLFSFGNYKETCTFVISSNQGELKYSSYGNGRDCSNDSYDIDDEQLKQLEKIIKNNSVNDWNGFDKKDEDAKNSDNFSIQIGYDDGTNIFAYGYMSFPDNYKTVQKELVDFFKSLNSNE